MEAMTKRVLIPILPMLAGAALFATPALASDPASEAVSQNWSGYVAASNDSSSGFSNVSGSWIEPTAKCTSSGATYSAFWVGLGGASDQSQALEQTGTQADCSAGGSTSYYAWYELVPSAPVQLNMTINPGDRISASVHVGGTSVTVSLTDDTTGSSVTKNLSMSDPDTSTAEWIAEAPSQCSNATTGDCQPLALADFGTVSFSGASATAGGHTGSISDPDWQSQAVALSPQDGGFGDSYGIGSGYGGGGYGYSGDGSGFAGDGSDSTSSSTAGAQPSSLSDSGSAFSVSYVADGSSISTSGQTSGSSSSGGSSSSSSGGSGSSTGGSGYGYPGSGYGYPGSGYGYSGGYGDGGSYGYSGGYGGGGYGYGGDGYGYSDSYYPSVDGNSGADVYTY